MSQNPYNTSDLTRGTGGQFGPTNPSSYPQGIPPGDLQPNPASNTSHQRGNNNQGGNYVPFPRTSGNPSSSNVPPGSQLEAYQMQPRGQEPFNNLAGSYSNPQAGTGQGGGQAGGYGGGNQNGSAGSTSANKGSSGSGR